MKQLLYIPGKALIFLLLPSLLAVSCKKLIGIPANPPDQIPQLQVFNDSADIISAVLGIYINYKVAGGGGICQGFVEVV